MNEEMIALAQRLIDCSRFRWMPGMRSVAYRQAPLEPVVNRIGDLKLRPYPGSLPDLSDPATLGCLASLVREAWSGLVVISLGAGWWSVQTDFKDWDQDNTKSFVDARVSALERA